MAADCFCLMGGGYWLKATHNVTQWQRDEATEYRRIVDESQHSVDRAVIKDPELMKHKEWLSRIAETSAASILHMLPSPAQYGRLQRHEPDLKGRGGMKAEVKWSGRVPPTLFGRRGFRDGKGDDPLLPYILVTGDEHQMTLHGWAYYGELARPDNWSEDWGNHGLELPHLPHRLPLHVPRKMAR